MDYKEGTFKNERGLNHYYQGWLPDEESKAILLVVHGVGEHCGRYMNVVDHFTPRGYAIYGFDHIGHGRSEGPREEIKDFDDFTEPLNAFSEMISRWHPGVPVFLYGHSLGALISCYYLLTEQEKFQGAIISAPPTKIPKNISPALVLAGRILSILAPKAGVVGLDTNGLSTDKSVVDAYNSDPLVYHGKMPARLSAEMLRILMKVNAEGSKIRLPVLICQGEQDTLVDPSGSKELYEIIGSTQKTLKYYRDFMHEIHNEPERGIFFADLESWFNRYLN